MTFPKRKRGIRLEREKRLHSLFESLALSVILSFLFLQNLGIIELGFVFLPTNFDGYHNRIFLLIRQRKQCDIRLHHHRMVQRVRLFFAFGVGEIRLLWNLQSMATFSAS